MLLFAGARAFQASVTTQAPNPNAPANFISVQAAVVAIAHARVIDGTGAPPRDDQTIVIRDGNIADLGGAASTTVPPGATTIAADIRKIDTVFKNGVGYDPGKLIASVRGQVGIW